MTRLPPDLLGRIQDQFVDDDTRRAVSISLARLWDGGINVGAAQLARAIVFLADGDADKFWELRSRFMGIPATCYA